MYLHVPICEGVSTCIYANIQVHVHSYADVTLYFLSNKSNLLFSWRQSEHFFLCSVPFIHLESPSFSIILHHSPSMAAHCRGAPNLIMPCGIFTYLILMLHVGSLKLRIWFLASYLFQGLITGSCSKTVFYMDEWVLPTSSKVPYFLSHPCLKTGL